MFLSYAVTVLYHTVPCNCTVPACCKACALRCSWGSACVSRLSLCPPLSHRAAWPRPPSPTPWPWVCGGGGLPALERCLALGDRPARLLPSPAPPARPVPAPTGVCSPPTSPPCSLALGGNGQGEKALPRRCQPGRKIPRINALLKSAKERGKRRSCACSFQNWSQNFYWVKSRHFIHQLAYSRTRVTSS